MVRFLAISVGHLNPDGPENSRVKFGDCPRIGWSDFCFGWKIFYALCEFFGFSCFQYSARLNLFSKNWSSVFCLISVFSSQKLFVYDSVFKIPCLKPWIVREIFCFFFVGKLKFFALFKNRMVRFLFWLVN